MYTDEYGVQFSDDRKKLIKCPEDFTGEYIIPESVETFKHGAFENCTKLQSLHIPSSISGNELWGLLGDCEGLQSISVAEENPRYCAVDGVLYFKDMSYIIRYPAAKEGTSYIIPEGVLGIASSAFAFCQQLESIQIPDSLNDVDMEAFECCSNLKSVSIPDLVIKSVSMMTFAGCVNLISIHLPESVTKIDYEAFVDCEKLIDINLPKSLEYIENGAFAGCTALRDTETYRHLLALGYRDEEVFCDDEGGEFDMGDRIEGEGVTRNISYYENEECLVSLHLHVFDDSFCIWREIRSMADYGFADRIEVHDKNSLMRVLDVNEDEDVIDALMETCKTEMCPLDMNRFFDLMESNQIPYDRTKTGDFVVDWSGDEPVIRFHPIENKE